MIKCQLGSYCVCTTNKTSLNLNIEGDESLKRHDVIVILEHNFATGYNSHNY